MIRHERPDLCEACSAMLHVRRAVGGDFVHTVRVVLAISVVCRHVWFVLFAVQLVRLMCAIQVHSLCVSMVCEIAWYVQLLWFAENVWCVQPACFAPCEQSLQAVCKKWFAWICLMKCLQLLCFA